MTAFPVEKRFAALSLLPALAALAGLVFVLGAAAPVAAQAETGEDPVVESGTPLEPASTNGHELDVLETGGEDPAAAEGTGGDVEVGGTRLSFIFFVIGIGAALIFLFLFFKKFILRRP